MRCTGLPSRTFTWTLEYPLVTFLTLLITLDILTAGEGYSVWDDVKRRAALARTIDRNGRRQDARCQATQRIVVAGVAVGEDA